MSHHPNGAVAGYTLGNGIVHSLTQNLRGLPEFHRYVALTYDRYEYDRNANVATITDVHDGSTSRSLGYDGLDRLTGASGLWGSGSFSYDTLDNLRSGTVGSRSTTHRYDVNNRLDLLTVNGALIGVAYDARGNVTGRGLQGYYFDQGNRMQLANGIASYNYDGHGRRMSISATSGNTRYHVYSQAG